MLRLLSQELWTLLASACEQASGIPKKILEDKAEELRIKNEAQKAIQVGMQGHSTTQCTCLQPTCCSLVFIVLFMLDGYSSTQLRRKTRQAALTGLMLGASRPRFSNTAQTVFSSVLAPLLYSCADRKASPGHIIAHPTAATAVKARCLMLASDCLVHSLCSPGALSWGTCKEGGASKGGCCCPQQSSRQGQIGRKGPARSERRGSSGHKGQRQGWQRPRGQG